ncbi:MAG: hypothetical protein FJW31_16950 [Acidobacteria bacterium]|nr:hypothetical protein [Acidobacteriota bacterium]
MQIHLCFFLSAAVLLRAGEWNQFRGPASTGVAEEKANPPVEFAPGKNVLWKTALPLGKSSPVFAGNRLFLTAHAGDELLTISLDRRNGKELWRASIARTRKEARHKLNDPAAPTPVTDGRNVYVFFADYGLAAYSASNGRELWRKPMGPFVSLQGVSASPVLIGSRVFVVCDQTRDSFIEAVDARTGKTLWRQERSPAPTGVYASPNVFVRNGEAQLVVPGVFDLVAYQPSTGEKLWWVNGLPGQPKSSAVAVGDTLYTASKGGAENKLTVVPYTQARAEYDKDGDGRLVVAEMPAQLLKALFKHLDSSGDGSLDETEWKRVRDFFDARSTAAAIRPTGNGDLTRQAIQWRYERSIPDVPTPLVYRGTMYLVQSGGILTALDAATGAVGKQARLGTALGDYYASPIAAAGRIYTVSQAGKLSVLKAGAADWEIVATADLGEETYATPAALGNVLYVRTSGTLYAFSAAAKK